MLLLGLAIPNTYIFSFCTIYFAVLLPFSHCSVLCMQIHCLPTKLIRCEFHKTLSLVCCVIVPCSTLHEQSCLSLVVVRRIVYKQTIWGVEYCCTKFHVCQLLLVQVSYINIHLSLYFELYTVLPYYVIQSFYCIV